MGKQKPKSLFDYTDTTPDTTPKKDLLDYTMTNTRSKETPLDASGYETFQGDSDYDQSLGHGMSQSYNRAVNQPWYDELGNALGRTALNIVPSTISQLAVTLDLEDYFNQDAEFGNELSRSMEEFKKTINQDVLPIYRKNPEEALNISDSAWWFENGGNLLESAGSFVATGGIISKGLQMLPRLAKIGALAKNVSPEKLELLTKAGQTLGTAFTLNQAEGGLSGMQVYDTVYQEALAEGIEDEEAKQKAADAAAYTVNINRANIPLNLTSSMAFLRSSKMSRGLLESINSGKKVAGEALQEGTEEIVNLIGEREGIRSGTESNYEYDFDKTISDVFSAEGLEAFTLGAAGGAVQTGGQSVLNRKQTGEHNQRVQEQQDYYTKLNDALKSTSTPDLFSFLQSAKDQGTLQKKIDQADLKGDVKLATELRNNLAEIQAFHAFENSAADKLEDTYKQIAKFTPEEAGKKGLDINPNSKDYYKLKAHEAISKITELEKTYNTLATRVPKEILKPAYLHNLENEKIRKEIRETDTEILKEQQKSLEEITAGLDLRETSNYDYLGELTSKKEALTTKLKESVLQFKDIVNGTVKEKQNDNSVTNTTDTKVPKSPEQQVKDKESKQLVKEFQDAVFESEEDIQKAVYELPEELRKSKAIKDVVRNKEQRVAYKQLFAEGEKIEVTKNGKKVTAVVIPEMYRLANSIVPTHINVTENGTISTFSPDSKKDTKTKTEDADTVVEENVPEPGEFVPDFDIPEPDDINFIDNDDSLNSAKTDKTKERKTKTSEKRKQEQQIVTEVKNTEKSTQLTISNENSELTNEFVQKIGYDYSRLNNPNNLNGEVRLSIEYIVYKEGGSPVATIIVEEQNEKGEWIKVTKLLKNYSGISEDLVKEFQDQFDAIEKYIKVNGSVITTVTDKQLYNYLNINKDTQSGIELLLTNDRAKNHLPDGEIYIGSVQGGVEKIRSIENDGKGGAVAIGKYPQEGRHFVVIKASNGTLVPVYLQDSKLSDIEVGGKKLIDDVIERIETIKQEFLQSELPKTQKELNNFWNTKKNSVNSIVGIDRDNFSIGLTLNKDGTITVYHAQSKKGEKTEQQVYELIGERFPNIQVDKLVSDPEYTKYLIKNRFLTTDLNTERPVINTQLKVDVSFLTKPERLRATNEPEFPEKELSEQFQKERERQIERQETDLEKLRILREKLNPTVDPSKVNNIKTRLVEKRDYKQLDLDEELEWIKNNLPQIPVEVVQSTLAIAKKFGVEAHGIFTNAMIYIAENGATGTAYHEAFHAVFNLYLTEDQRNTLLKEGTEEQLADQFAEYVQTEGNIKPKSNIISDFFRDLYYWIKDIIGLTSTKDIFYQINTGKFANSPIQESQFKPENKYKVVEGFNALEQKQRVESLLYQVFNGLRNKQNKGSILSIDPDTLTAQDYSSIWNDIEEMWRLEQDINAHPNREKVLNNWNEFKELTTKELKRFGIKAVEKVVDEKIAEDTNERIYDVAYFKNNIKDTLSTEIKLFIATVPVVKVLPDGSFENDPDELGNPKFVDRHKVYSDLSRELADVLSIEGMINKLEFLANSTPQWYYISDFLKRTTSIVEAEGITSNNFRNKFYSTFRKHNNKFVTIKKFLNDADDVIYSIIDTNKRGLDKQIIGKWKDSNEQIKSFDAYTPFATEVRKFATQLNDRENKDSLKIVEKHLKSIGIDISLPALENHKEAYFKTKNVQPYTNYLLEKNKATIGQILNAFSSGRNIFGGEDGVGELTAIKNLAKFEVQVSTDTTNGAFLNGEDEMVYPINLPSFATNRLTELKENVDNILQRLVAVPYLKNSRIINGLINDQDFKNQFDIGVFDTINDGTKKKQSNIPYSESQDFEFVISKIHAFFNGKLESKYGWFFPPTPSDKGNITPVKLAKLNITSTPLFINGKLNPDSEFTKWLYDAVEDEFNRIKQTWDSIESIPESEQILNYHYRIDKEGNRLLGNAFYFNQFHMLNELIYEDINNPELSISNINELDQTLLLETLSTKFLTLVTNERDQLVEKGVLSKTGNTYSKVKGVLDSRIGDLKVFTDSYIINQFYANYELSNLFSGDMAFSKGNPLTPESRKIQFADYNKRFGESFVPGTELGHSKEFSDVVKSTFRVEIANDIEISNPELSKVSKKYLKNNQTDAQGFITLERQREIMIGQGTFNEKYKKAWERVRKGGTDITDISTVFQPIKGFYFSQDINEYGILVPTQVKYSSVPLIPALYQQGETVLYPELKSLNERMVSESIDEYVFESGVKKGRTENSIIELQNKNWRQPQVVPYKDSTEERFGSQKRKLVTENIDESDTFEGRNLKEYYQELIAKNIEEDFKLVAPELSNIDVVAKTLLEQLVENNTKGLPDKFEKAMEVIKGKYGKDTRMSLDNPLIKKRVESVFNSFIDSRVVDQKLPGFSAVQVSTFGQVKVASDLKFIRKEGDKVEAAQVKVTPKYFIKMLKKQGVDITSFIKNGNIDINKIPKDLLKGTLHRIPTQGKNSMLSFEIVEFTPNEMGSVIFLPVEVTTQMGSDFDIDKVYIETYNFEVVDGKLQKVEGDKTKQGRQNKIVDIHYNILTNPKYFDEVVTPNNSDTLITIKKEVLKFEKERGDSQQLEEFWFSPWLQEEFKKRNQAGKQLVGFYSIISTAHSVAQDIKMKLKDGFTVNFNGKELNDLSKVKDITGTRISDNIAERQTAAVDNAKDPILGYLNDNLFTAPVKALLLRVGLPLRHTDYFTCQPIIVDLTKAFFKNSPGMSDEKALQKAITEVVKKYTITDKLITITGDKIQPANFNLESLKDGLKGKGDPKAILEAFLYYEKIGKSLYTVSLGLSPDRKGTASTMSENLYNQEKIREAKTNNFISFDQDLYNKHSLAAFEKYGIDEAIRIASGYYNKENELGHKIIYFSDGTELFTSVMDNIGKIKGESLNVKERQDITYQFYTYLHTGSELLKISNEEKLKIFTGPTSVVNRLRRYKVAKAEGREDNLMLNNLNIVKDKDTGFETLEFNATANPALSPEEKQIFEDSILELYRAGGAKKTFAVDLLKYCSITNGFSRGTNTFIDYFPIEMFEETGLNEYYKDIKQSFDNLEDDDFNIERFTDQYIQNNFDSLYWIPQYTNKSVKEKALEEMPLYYYNRTTKKLFKQVEPTNDTPLNAHHKSGHYIEINKLGRKNFIKEYDIDSDLSSIISTNNKSGKNQVESQEQEIAKDQLINVLDKLSKRFNIEYVIDNTMTVLGRYSNGKVFINPNLAKSDTPFHEFAHPFVETIKQKNPILYKNLEKQIRNTAEGIQILNKVKRLYPVGKDYTIEDQIEEAIVTAIGQYGAKQIKDKGLITTIKMLLKRIARYLQDVITVRKDLAPEELSPNISLEDLARIVAGEDKIKVTANTDSNKEQREEIKEQSKFAKQTEFFRKRLYTLGQELKKHKPNSIEYKKRENYINTIKEKLTEAIENNNKGLLKELGEETLAKAEEFIIELEKGTSKDKAVNIMYAEDVIHTWTDFGGLRDRSAELYERLLPFIEKFSEERVNAFATEGKTITKKDINSQTEDIGTFTKSVGALADLSNYIGRTIGSIIKAAQNKISTKGKKLKDEIEEEIKGLSSYAKKKGITLDKVYDILVQERKGTLILAKKYLENGDENPNWKTIQDNPELKKFYTYYQTTIEKFENSLPIKMGKYFIPNIKKDSVKDTLNSLNPIKERKVGKEIEEELISDVVPIKYYKKINADEKSRNLGESLLEFGKMTYTHNEMSKILPEVRLLQRQLTFKLDSNGEVEERLFGKSSNNAVKISGDKTNLYKMIDTIIEMQVKGVMKQEEGKFKISTIYDEQGNPVKEKYVDVTGTMDNLIKWNSLLRIGLSPITALTNVTFGDISNAIEAVGGRFFGLNDLRKATNIFIKQTMNDGSVLNQLLLELNPLQELDDYEMISDSTVKGKMSKEKLQEYMYSLQKAGEKFLQSRTMIAIMIRDGYLTSSGVKTQKYTDLTEQQKEQLVDKIQRVNQMIHGRYTQREAAALQQSVIFRLVSQFRKWIPAAIENRIGSKQYDNRLQAEIEGRYRTIGRVVGKELFRGNVAQAFENLLLPLVSYQKALASGKLTEMEIYNMRKNLTEIILTAGTILLLGGLKGDEDDEEWRKNPYVKTGLTLLNRVSGDLLFFYSPESGIQLTKNIAPVAKLVDDTYKAIKYIPYAFYIEGSEFKTGSRKGKNRFYNTTGGLVPGIKPILDALRMVNDRELEELR